MSDSIDYNEYGKHFEEYIDDEVLYTEVPHNDIIKMLKFTTINIENAEKFIIRYKLHHNCMETVESLLNISDFEFGEDIDKVFLFLDSLSSILSTTLFTKLSHFFKNIVDQHKIIKSEFDKLNKTVQSLQNEQTKLKNSKSSDSNNISHSSFKMNKELEDKQADEDKQNEQEEHPSLPKPKLNFRILTPEDIERKEKEQKVYKN